MATPRKYILVPKRIKVNSNGDVILKLKSRYRDGTTHWLLSHILVLRSTWTSLSNGRVFSSEYSPKVGALGDIDMERCPNCQGRLTIIAAIENPSTIAKILKHLGLPARAPPRAPAKNPAFYEFTEFVEFA